jgi:general L-amino acid transport system permease protein
VTATVLPGRVPLWRDVRVLQWLFQLLVVAASAAIVIWLYGNYTTNSQNLGIPTNFDFLDNPAAFEITGNEMSQSAPVRDAYVQGFLNTMRISVAGIVAATVLGTVIGIARLSKNWLVSKMAAVYVEAIRNVPLPCSSCSAHSRSCSACSHGSRRRGSRWASWSCPTGASPARGSPVPVVG